MRDTLRLLGIIALAVIIGLSMVACDNGSTTDTGDKTPVADNYIVSGTGTQTVGQAIAVTVTRKENASPGEITVLYNGSATVPSSSLEGSYAITFDVAAASGWKEAKGLNGGLLIISNTGNKPIPSADDFNYTGTEQTYTGDAKRLGITPKDSSKSNGVITIYYDGKASPAFEPVEEGTYKVTFDVGATDKHQSIRGLIAPDLVITPAITGGEIPPVAEDFEVIGIGNYPVDGSQRYVYIIPKDGKSRGKVTVWYNDSDEAPKEKGQYKITFDVTASGAYSAAKGLDGGWLYINGELVELRFFDISGLSQVYDGTPKGVKIRPKAEYQVLTTIVKYQASGGVPVSNAPYQVGEYNVTFDVPDAVGFAGNSGKPSFEAGKLVISPTGGSSAPSANSFVVEGLGNHVYDAEMAKVVSVNTVGGAPGGVITVKYQDVNGSVSTVAPFNAGTYDVSYDVGASASNAATTIPAGKLTIEPRPPVLGDFVVENRTWTYDGSPKSVNVTSNKLNFTNRELDIRYGGSTTAPTDAGTYNVTFSLAANPNWQAVSELPAGEMEIRRGIPQSKDFTVTLPGPHEYNGVAIAAPSCTLATGVSDGPVSFTYNGEAARPVDAGTYAVVLKFGTSPTGNWETRDFPVDSVTINSKRPTKDEFNFTGLSQVAYSFAADTLPRIEAKTGVLPAYPPFRSQPAISYVDSKGKKYSNTLANLNTIPPGLVKVTVPIAAQPNWLATSLEYDMNLADLEFTTARQFKEWLNGRPGSGEYSAKFSTGALATNADLILAIGAIKDRNTQPNAEIAEPRGSNGSKNLRLDLTGAFDGGSATIPVGGFTGCSNLLELNLTGGPGTIPDNSFDGCTKLETLVLSANTTSIPSELFKDCNLLKVLDLGNVATVVRDDLKLANGNRIPLKEVTLNAIGNTGTTYESTPPETPSVATSAFERLTSLTTLNIKGTTSSWSSANAFKGCTGLLSVTFPETWAEVNIEASAFEGCENLNSVTFPVTSWTGTDPKPAILSNAFKDCKKLTTLDIPAGLVSIAADAFAGNTPIATVTMASPATGTEAFRGKKSLTAVTLKTGVTSIASNAFNGCDALTTITFPIPSSGFDGTIGASAFEGCSSLTGVTLPTTLSGANAIGARAFYGCTSLRSINLSAYTSYTTIAAGTFKGSGLTSIVIPTGISIIKGYATGTTGDGAFENCASLASVSLASDTGTIESNAFTGCTSLVTLKAGTITPATDNGIVNIPTGIVNLAADVFRNCTSITKVVLNPDAGSELVEYRGDAFTGCNKLEKLTIEGGAFHADNVGGLLFGNTPVANKVSSIETIEWKMTAGTAGTSDNTIDFTGTGVKTLIVSKTVTGDLNAANVFPNTLDILRIAFDQTGVAAGGTFTGLPVTKVYVGTSDTPGFLGYALDAKTASTAFFPRGVTYIEFEGVIGTITQDPFYNIAKFDLVVNDAATKLGAFTGKQIANVTLGEKVKPAITAAVFGGTNLAIAKYTVVPSNTDMASDEGVLYNKVNGASTTLIHYPRAKTETSYSILPGVTIISDNAFANTTIQRLTIPSSVQQIGTSATPFASVTTLGTINYNATNATIQTGLPVPTSGNLTLNIGYGVTDIPAPFVQTGTTIVNELVIPETVRNIGATSFTLVVNPPVIEKVKLEANLLTAAAFKGNTNVKYVTIGSNVKNITKETFMNTKVFSVDLGGAVNIGDDAFKGTSLNELIIPESVGAIATGAFDLCPSLQKVTFETSTVFIMAEDAFPEGNTTAYVPEDPPDPEEPATVALKTVYDEGGAGVYGNGDFGSRDTPLGWGWKKMN